MASSVTVLSSDVTGSIPAETSADAEALRLDSREYLELRRLIREEGLLDRQPTYYSFKISLTLVLLAAGFALVVLVDHLGLVLVSAAFWGFLFAQLGLIGHDAGHQQIFASVRRNDYISLSVGFLIGMVPSWWNEKHNMRHHSNPNRIGMDGDIDVSVLAFTVGRALSKTGFHRFMVRHQAFLFIPTLALASVSFLFASIHYVLTGGKLRYPVVETLLVIAHLGAYLGLLFTMLNPWHALLFILVHKSVEGLYMGSVFAPNHKGMPVLEKDTDMGFLRQQVITSRDVKAHPITDFVYGGLNYQIEHHLFPNMARNNLGKAQKVVREFCLDRGISYHETSVMGSQREILGYLHRTSAPLRSKAL